MKRSFSLIISLALFFSPSAFTHGHKKGNEIAKIVHEAAKGYGGESSSVELTIRNKAGKTKKRSFNMKLKEGSNGGYSMLTTFTKPMDLAKTKLLTVVNDSGYDQWLKMGYLAKGKKVEAGTRTKSFVDSDLSYEDMASLSGANYKNKFVKESQGGKVWIIDQSPTGKSGYKKRSVYVSKKYKYPTTIYYYAKNGSKIKTAEFKGFKSYKANGKTFWFPSSFSVKNHKTGSETNLTYTKRSIGIKISDSDFNSSKL